ncbi:MAG: T9SS type A sorting domain-containing protein [Janthinobacterium lividum]
MKNILYAAGLLLLGLASHSAAAQAIPNGTFETWSTRSTAEAPASWLTQDDVLAAVFPSYTFNTGTVVKSTDAHGGAFAAKLTNIAFGSGTTATVLEGFLVLGQKLGGEASYGDYPIAGIPYTARPTQWQFYYKLTGPASDAAEATLLLTKKDPAGGLPLILGGGTVSLVPTTGGYQQALITIPYTSSAAPDSVRMQFSSGTGSTIAAGSELLIDDISLLGAPPLATRADASTQALLAVSPNPSPAGRFHLSAPGQPALASAPYAVLDLTGRVVARQPALSPASPTRDIDLSNLQTGLYVLRLDSPQGVLTRQLVVK